jgi:hypothetical protein
MLNNKVLNFVIVSSLSSFAMLPLGNAEGGRNGPDLRGKAIPSGVERQFKEEEVLKATKICGQTISMQIYEQLFKRSSSELREKDITGFVAPPSRIYDNGSTNAGIMKYYDSIRSENADLYHKNSDGEEPLRSNGFNGTWTNTFGSKMNVTTGQFYIDVKLKLAPGDLSEVADRTPTFVVDAGLPMLMWLRLEDNVKTDERGSIISSVTKLKHLNFVYPQQYKDNAEVMRTHGPRTNPTKTKVRVDVSNYVNCLRGELQR